MIFENSTQISNGVRREGFNFCMVPDDFQGNFLTRPQIQGLSNRLGQNELTF
jgi:hypothetical protein